METPRPGVTSWHMIERAAAGDALQKQRFASMYEPMILRCLRSRWRVARRSQFIEDATQEVFVECLRQGGLLQSASGNRPHSFRKFLAGAIRNVARRFEARMSDGRIESDSGQLEAQPDSEDDLLKAFEREWARSAVSAALQDFGRRETESGAATPGRQAELLRLRFTEGLPIRGIAARWSLPPEQVHREYARARRGFRACLEQVVQERDGLEQAELDLECRRLLELLA